MTRSRLGAAAAALVLFAALVAGGDRYAERVARRTVHAIAPEMFAEKTRGSLLQRAAFREQDLLPLYGSSELLVPDPAHASALFRDYPSGFTVFPVGAPGSASLVWLQALAAVGGDLRGRRVAISLSPRLFSGDMADPQAYAATFSPLHANALAFSTRLGFAVRQAAARRMLAYPETLADDPLLAFALARLAGGSWSDRLLYQATRPLGVLRLWALRLQDAVQTLRFLRAQPNLHPPARRPQELDWNGLQQRAADDARGRAAGTPFGFDAAFWTEHAADVTLQRGSYPADAMQRDLEHSAEWLDLDLLLRAIRELGGEPLLLSAPMKGPYYDHLGAPAATRGLYYRRLADLARRRGVPVRDFADREGDPYFTVDPALHLSSAGWLAYARALDAFFHRRPADDI